jgi:transcriptional regulatory protein LevR
MKENSIINKQAAEQIVVESLKKRKCIERVEVSTVEQKNEIWVVRGTCPIDMEGHPWAEKFEVTVDTRGRVKSIDFALL